jgi:hypothetical protein
MSMGVPVHGWIIALAAAMQESNLVNPPDLGDANNADSLGLFQQRPSQGRGTPDQIMNPIYSSTTFFEHLLAVSGWQTMTVAQAVQVLERSAFPDAYAQREPDATQLVAATVVGSDLHRASTVPGMDSGCVAAAGVLARAATWLTGWAGGPVPYLSSADPHTWLAGYRRDCSGYASMALGLPGPGLDTATLAARSTPIGRSELRAGDLMINPADGSAGHVVIFDRWADASMTNYLGYEQSADGGTHHRVLPYPYFGEYPMTPYRL